MGHYIATTTYGAYDRCTDDSAMQVSAEETGLAFTTYIGIACCDSAGGFFRPVEGTTLRCLYGYGYDHAEEVCTSYGQRPCTMLEIKSADDPSAGCEVATYHELEHVWTSTGCTLYSEAEAEAVAPQVNLADAAESPQLKVLHKHTRPQPTVFAFDVPSNWAIALGMYVLGVLTVLLALNLWRMDCFGASTGLNRQYAAVDNADSEECNEFDVESINVQGN